MRVLVADDSAISRRLLEAALTKWGFEVVIATDGSQAWECLRTDSAPRLAILDWMMPGLSGPEVCRRVRESGGDRYTYILLVTSRGQREDVIEGMEAGADDYLTKPFDQNELKVRLGPGRRIVELQDALFAAQTALREQATVDALTRLWNRRVILELCDREIERARREHMPVGVVLGDLDRFKSVNDTHGHLVGDAVLAEVAARLKASSRKYDDVGRYGGEEFLLILPGCDGASAECQAERLRLEIAGQRFECAEGVSIDLTCSFGVTALPAGEQAQSVDLIRLADSALLHAKQIGRNTVVQLPFTRPGN